MSQKKSEATAETPQRETCGIVMPISPMGDYDVTHWGNVRDVLCRAASRAGLEPSPVWESFETDIIHGKIVLNLYRNPMVICDVSGLNPNVMFELGLRMAFQKPVIIVCDDITKIPFDTHSIEHFVYPRNLRFQDIELFMDKLSARISSTLDSVKNGDFKSFIHAFGPFEIAEIKTEEVPVSKYVLERLDQIASGMQRLEKAGTDRILSSDALESMAKARKFRFFSRNIPEEQVGPVQEKILGLNLVQTVEVIEGDGKTGFFVTLARPVSISGFSKAVENEVQSIDRSVAVELFSAT